MTGNIKTVFTTFIILQYLMPGQAASAFIMLVSNPVLLAKILTLQVTIEKTLFNREDIV